jgi:serine/threonine-protein kinase
MNVQEFLNVIRRSGLIEADRLSIVVREMDAYGGPPAKNAEQVAARLVSLELLTRWQADNLLAGRWKGFFLNDMYKLLAHLGRDVPRRVFLAQDMALGRLVAIKVSPETTRLYHEAQAIAFLSHPHLVPLYAFSKDDTYDYCFLVMEYIEGQTFAEVVAEKGPPLVEEAVDWTIQVATGLEYMHAMGVIHRAVNPSHLMLTKCGLVKVLGLGVACRTANPRGDCTAADQHIALSTSEYLAPEQVLDTRCVDPRADIYSLGCTFYFCLTGHPPFGKGTRADQEAFHAKRSSIRNERPDVPEPLDEVFRKMAAERALDRYQSMGEVIEALKSSSLT